MSHTVLLIDDDADSRQICRTILAHHGYDILEAPDALKGIAAARESTPDVVLMDINLPGVDGLTATRMLKEGPLTQAIPVIIFSARATSADRDRGMSAGCDGYLTKPCPPSRIVSEVRRVLATLDGIERGGASVIG